MKQTDILIIGGGIAGLSLTAILQEAGVDVICVDPYPPKPLKKTQPTGRTVALMNSSLNIIKAAGVWDTCESHACPMQAMRIIDRSLQGREDIRIDFPATDIGEDQFGYNIPNTILRAALGDAVKTHKATLSDYSVEGSHVIARFEDSKEIKARLIIGADGRKSVVRAIAGIKSWNHNYGQSAITCLINHSKSHGNTSTEFHRPGGPLALVPLPGNQSSVVWVERTAKADQLIALKKGEFIQALEDATDSILGSITLETGPEAWPLGTIKAKALAAPRMALAAEAAHVLSPITAQGLNLSLRDIAALAETIVDGLRLGLDPGDPSLLRQYEKRRQVDINTRVLGVDGMNRIVSQDADIIKGLRRAGLKTVGAVHPLKSFAMQTGLAPQMDQGRLATGEPL